MRAALSDALDATRAAEVRTAARALLRSPLLHARGTRREVEAFAAVRRHERELREWFDHATGWRLVVTPEVARLLAVPPDPHDATHPLRESGAGERPFTRRRYVLACLCLAALERADTQITLGRLAEQAVLLSADPDLEDTGWGFRLESRDERLDLVAVVRVLLSWGVLARVAGAEDAFVREDGDVLYDVDRRVLAVLLVTPPTALDALLADTALGAAASEASARSDGGAAPGGPALSEEARTRALRHRLTQLLLCLPVVHHADLTAPEQAYLLSQRTALTGRISALTGLVAEVRAEGIAMVDPDDALTDVRMPESGTDGHLTLLLAEHLARVDREHPGRAVALADLHAVARDLAVEHRSDWRQDTRAPGADVVLVETALGRLAALRLVQPVTDDGRASVVARPALHRYAVAAPVRPGTPTGGRR